MSRLRSFAWSSTRRARCGTTPDLRGGCREPGQRQRRVRTNKMVKFATLALSITTFLGALAGPLAAQDYPARPIRMIIPFPPGGGSDVAGRVVAAALSERLGKQVIVDNRAGAGGIIGSELAANAPKDGYTLLMVSLAHTVNPWLYDLKGRYDPIKSFTPVALIAASPVVLVVHPSVQANSDRKSTRLNS